MPEALNSQNSPRITVLGGGHGPAAVAPELARLTSNATAIISMSDNGGISQKLMETVSGLDLPVGDFSRVVFATSNHAVVRNLEDLRYSEGPYAGHAARHLITAALFSRFGPKEGSSILAKAMGARGTILPATFDPHELVMEEGGLVLRGESCIDKHVVDPNAKPWVWHEPSPRINPDAERAIIRSDLLVLGPGSMLSSILGVCSEGVKKALHDAKAPKVFVVNLVNGDDTPDWHVADHINLLRRHDIPVDYAIFNLPTAQERAHFAQQGRQLVDTSPGRFAEIPRSVRPIGAAVLSTGEAVRHDAQALIKEFVGVLANHNSEVGLAAN